MEKKILEKELNRLYKENNMKQYVLVSQGIELFRTFNKQEAEEYRDRENANWYDYRRKCAENFEFCADNKVFMYEEDIQHWTKINLCVIIKKKLKEKIMSKIKTMGASPITNTIYYGTLDTDKSMWIGNRTDVTDMAIKGVFEWFMNNMDGNKEYEITFPNTEYTLKMVRKEK